MAVNFTLDIVLLCVFLLFVAVGIRRGFIRSAAHFLGSVIAAFLASVLGGAAAQWVFDVMFRRALVEKISESIGTLGTENVSAALEGLLSSLPDFIARALEDAGITVNSLEGVLATRSGQAAELIADSLAPVFVGFLKVLAVIVLFLLFMMLVRVLADMLSGLFHLPLLRQLNGLLGGVFGFLLGLVSVWIVISAVQVFTPMLAAETQANVKIALNRSMIAGAIIRMNPLGAMFR